MSSTSNYDLTVIKDPFDPAVLDTEFLIFRLFKACPQAKFHIDEDGNSTGNDGTWRTIEEEMKAFSLQHPTILFEISEDNKDYDYKAKHFFQNGKACTIEPKIVWPEFKPEMLA